MPAIKKQAGRIDAYIKTFPPDVQGIFEKVRQTIRKVAPEAEESISYNMPTFKLNGTYLIYFSGWKKHLGLYPIPKGTAAFQRELSPYQAGKGTVRLPLDKPIPYDLVRKMVAFRMKENQEKQK